MIDKIIEPGNKIEIEYAPTGGEKLIYKSRVYDVMDYDRIRIAMPVEDEKLKMLALNVRYKFCFHTKSGDYQCYGVVQERFTSENRCVAIVSLKHGLRKVEKQDFYRLEQLMDIEYRQPEETELQNQSCDELVETAGQDGDGPKYKKGIAVEMSGGGLRFISDETYPVSSYIIVRFYMDGSRDECFCLMGKVVVSQPIEGKEGQCENQIVYEKLPEKQREKLIRYIFREEQRMRQKV